MSGLNKSNVLKSVLAESICVKGQNVLCEIIRYHPLTPTNDDVYVFFNKNRTTELTPNKFIKTC